MGNPFNRGAATPDKLFTAPDLTPQAKVVGDPYQQTTARNVAEAPRVNTLEQLGGALSSLVPATSQLAGAFTKKASDKEIADATESYRKSGKSLTEATAAGLIPPGASQRFIDTYQALDAKRQADNFGSAFYDAYSKRPNVSNSDNLGDFQKFSEEFKQQYDQDHLINADTGAQKYTPLQMKEAGYQDLQQRQAQALEDHHVKFRIDQRTQRGQDIFTGAVADAITAQTHDAAGAPIEPHAINWDAAAASIRQATEGQTTGMVETGGMTTAKATELTALGVIATARDLKDPSVIDAMGTALDKQRPAAFPITGTVAWKKHAEEGKRLIANEMYSDKVHEDNLISMDVQGTPDERRQVRKAQYEKQQTDQTRANLTHESKQNIYNFADLRTPSSDTLEKQAGLLMELRKTDSPAALEVEQTLHAPRNPDAAKAQTHQQSVREMELSREVQASPTAPRTSKMIDAALREGQIDGSAWNRLHNDQVASRDNKVVLSDPAVTNIFDAAYKGSVANLEKITGSEAIAGSMAKLDMQRQAAAYLKQHPAASGLELGDWLSTRLQGTVNRYNSVKVEEHAQDVERQRITDEALQRAQNPRVDAEAAQLKQASADEQARAGIRKEYAARYPDPKQLDAAVEQVFQHRRTKKVSR